MDEIKSFLKSFIWSGKDVHEFESWLYKRGTVDLEKLVGSEQYMNIIGYDYRRSTIYSVKKLIKENINESLISEFENYFAENERMIKGKCIKNESLDYTGNDKVEWGLEIGKTYDILELIEESKTFENHQSLVNFVDKDDFFIPSGYVPMELFEIDKSRILEYYKKNRNENGELITEPNDWSKEVYKATQYSFWEDYYENEEKAVNKYFSTLDKLGIKNVW